MALINCPECKREVSDQAAACPHCGLPIATQKPDPAPAAAQVETPKVEPKKRNVQKLLAVLLTLFSLIAAIASGGKMYWILLFLVGLGWFIVLRILRD
jgi:predicted amidophosphoribosyltransferase